MSRGSSKFRKGLARIGFTVGTIFAAAGLAVAQPNITTELNGNRLYFDQPPVMQEGRVLVPLRGIFENLGADVLYTPATKQIKATGSGNTVELTLGERQAFINGRQVYLDVPAGTIAGRTMVPLRFVSEAMGAEVKWQSASRTVAITHDGTDEIADNEEQQQPDEEVRPRISQLLHNARGTLNPGDDLVVTLLGTPDARASFAVLGAVQEVRMSEISPGRYEGRLNIHHNLNIDQGTLVGYLRKDNLETAMEADRAISVAADSSQEVTYVSPSPGTIVSQTRPTLTAVFPEYIRSNTANIMIDGQRFTPIVQSDGRTVAMTPSYSLNPGVHTVEVSALDQNGQEMRRNWHFTVSQSAVNNPSLNPSVSISNLTDGARVPAVFNIQGQTSPYTKVKIDATSQRPLIPGIIGLTGRTTTTSTVSDAQGRFNVQMNTSNLPVNSQIDLEVSAIDANGNVTDSVDLNLIRQ
ncbi:MAG: stalk domain-containing protein [Vulcanimicrobiota bacterium]